MNSLNSYDNSYMLFVKLHFNRPFSAEEEGSIVNGSPYLLRTSYRSGNLFIDVYNKEKKKIGYVIPSIEYDKGVRYTVNSFAAEHEDDDAKVFFLVLDNLFAFDTIEHADGYCYPAICEFGGFFEEKYFKIRFFSEEYPRG